MAVKVLIGLPLLALAAFLWFGLEPVEPWLSYSWQHPLGTDEFGRDFLAVLIGATALSLSKAVIITLIAIIISTVIAYLAIYFQNKVVEGFFRGIVIVVESCPILLWVFVVIIAFSRLPVVIAVTVAFIIAATPFVSNVIAGELERLWKADYVRAARILGIGEWRILMSYILPNAVSVLIPVALNVLGAALTVSGAIGILGMGNRSELDLGILLLRGKENVLQNPTILIVTVMTFIGIYIYIFLLKNWMLSRLNFSKSMNNKLREPA